MKNLRIIKGKVDVPGQSALKTLFQNGDLSIEGSSDVKIFKSDDGREAFLLGSVTGIREGKTNLKNAAPDAIKNVLFTQPVGKAIDQLEGSYIAVVTGKGGECDVFLDRYGNPDVYILKVGDAVVLGSDLSLLPMRETKGYDQNALAHVLTVYGYRPPKKHTIFEGVSRLGVREVAKIAKSAVKIEDIGFEPLPTEDYGKDKLEEYADLFLDSLKARGSENGNVVYLSSGWDSSAILAGLVHVFGKDKVRAVTGRMFYSERTKTINQFEIDRAKEIADFFGVKLDIAEFDYWQKGPDYLEADKNTLNAHNMSSITAVNHMRLAETALKTANKEGEAVFVGEISDGAHNLGFSQFVTIFHRTLGMREYSDKMNSYLFGPTFWDQLQKGAHMSDEIYELLRGRAGSAIFDERAQDPKEITKQLFEAFFLRSARLPLYSRKNAGLLTEGGQDAHNKAMGSYFEKIVDKVNEKTLYSWYLQIYNSFHWQGSTVRCVTLAGESKGLNMQLPFRDSRLIDFLSAMPEDWGRGLEIRPTKYPLKWALENKVKYPLHLQVGPHSYLYDVDPNFSHSAELLYGSSFTPYLKNVLKKKAYEDVLDGKTFKMDYIDKIVKNYLDGKEVVGVERNDLFSICMLEWMGDIKRQDLVESK